MALGQVKFIYLTRGLRAKRWEHNCADHTCCDVSFGAASCVQPAAGEDRAFAEYPGRVPGSLQTVFGNCEVGISGVQFTGENT